MHLKWESTREKFKVLRDRLMNNWGNELFILKDESIPETIEFIYSKTKSG